MSLRTQLLCTFTNSEDLEFTVERIKRSYHIAFNSIYILENTEDEDELYCTYNIDLNAPTENSVPPYTISLHRKKQTNTLYTINALNRLIEQENGNLDKKYQVKWEEYRNSILVTQYGELKIISTKVRNIIKLDES